MGLVTAIIAITTLPPSTPPEKKIGWFLGIHTNLLLICVEMIDEQVTRNRSHFRAVKAA